MNIAFCSLLLPEEKNIVQRTKGRLPGMSLHKLATALIKGLDANVSEPISVFNIINTLNYPKFPELRFKTEAWAHAEGAEDWHIGYINLIGIKYITQTNHLYRKLKQWVKKQNGDKTVIYVHHIYLPMMLAALRIKRRFPHVKICLITGDMYGRGGLTKEKKLTLKEQLIKGVEWYVTRLARRFDAYVFATEAMAEGYGVADKPHCVLECTYNSDGQTEITYTGEEKTIFYAGALRDDYGMPHLLRAFSKIADPDYRLWLAGGSATETIQTYLDKDPRITLLGFLSLQEVASYQQRATVLISPRTAEHEFVKYSFPSKTMECLASGKPYIAHRLPCDPPEYAAHIQHPENESDEALADKIVQVCEMTAEARAAIGRNARTFIVEEKNPKAMCERMIAMCEQLLTCSEYKEGENDGH